MITSSTGENLHSKVWKVEAPKAEVYLVHGYAEHIGRYEHLAQRLNAAGYDVIGYDHAGHGDSGGERAYIDRFDQFVWDLDRVIEHHHDEGKPIYLFGHSMGGLVVTSYCTLYQPKYIQGVITSGAGLKVNKNVSKILQRISPVMSEICAHLKTTSISSQDVSRDPKVVEEYDNDPKVYRGGIKTRIGSEILLRMKKTSKVPHLFKVPTLMMHGTLDEITDPGGTIEFCEKCASDDKELKLWDGLYHEIMNEPEKEEVIDYMISWLEARQPEQEVSEEAE